MKWLNIISLAVGIIVSLPLLTTTVFTWVRYGDVIFTIAESCLSKEMDCNDERWKTVPDDIADLQKQIGILTRRRDEK